MTYIEGLRIEQQSKKEKENSSDTYQYSTNAGNQN